MPLREGIRATIRRFEDNEPYSEHQRAQDGSTSDSMRKEVYVEAVSGERFYVLIELSKFPLEFAPDLQTACRVDDNIDTNFYRFRFGGKCQVMFKSKKRFIDGKWKRCALLFKGTDIGMFPRSLDVQQTDVLQTKPPNRPTSKLNKTLLHTAGYSSR